MKYLTIKLKNIILNELPFSKEKILHIGNTGSKLIDIKNSKDYDVIVVLNEEELEQYKYSMTIDNEHIDIFLTTISDIRNNLLNIEEPYHFKKIFGALCSLDNYSFELADFSKEELDMIKTNIKTIIKTFENHQYTVDVIEKENILTYSTMKLKSLYYLPLIRHIFENNNFDYPQKTIELARKIYNKESTDEEFESLYNYFGVEFIHDKLI